MQVLAKRSDTAADVECRICGQGFRLYFERSSPAERDAMRTTIYEAIHRQHLDKLDESAHPLVPFTVPGWTGRPQHSAAALLGGFSGVFRVPPPAA